MLVSLVEGLVASTKVERVRSSARIPVIDWNCDRQLDSVYGGVSPTTLLTCQVHRMMSKGQCSVCTSLSMVGAARQSQQTTLLPEHGAGLLLQPGPSLCISLAA